MHGSAYAIAVAEINIVAHTDLIAVVDDWRARERQQQADKQLNAAAVIVQQWCQPSANTDIDTHARVCAVGKVHVVPLVLGHHLQRELIVVAQEESPLTVLRNLRRLRHNFCNGQAILLTQRHVHAWHQRKVERHRALITLTEIRPHIAGPLIGFSKDDAV